MVCVKNSDKACFDMPHIHFHAYSSLQHMCKMCKIHTPMSRIEDRKILAPIELKQSTYFNAILGIFVRIKILTCQLICYLSYVLNGLCSRYNYYIISYLIQKLKEGTVHIRNDQHLPRKKSFWVSKISVEQRVQNLHNIYCINCKPT